MKKILVAALAMSLFATSAFAVISGSLHDMTSRDTGTNDETCVYCHTPHSASTSVTAGPLWNRTNNLSVTDVYNSGTIEATTKSQMTTASIEATDAPLCLSCHDGDVAETLVNEPNSGDTAYGNNTFTGSTVLDADFSDDHPIGFSYVDAQGTDPQLYDKATVEGSDVAMDKALSFGDTNDMMWCSSCHDVHGVSGVDTFLRVDNAGSALCTTCHNK